MITYELYLTKKSILLDEWYNFIKSISNYNGYLKKWYIIIENKDNKISYYLKVKKYLPSSFSNNSSFLLKEAKVIDLPKYLYTLPTFKSINKNLINILDYFEIYNKGQIKYFEISFLKISYNKIIKEILIYTEFNKMLKVYKIPYSNSLSFFDVDYDKNIRYKMKSIPKYLDITKIIPYLSNNKEHSLFKIDSFPYNKKDNYLNIENYDFFKHSLIIGASGSGKSKFLSLFISNLFKSNLKDNYKIIFIDPHASLERDLKDYGSIIDFKTINKSIDLFFNSSNNIISTTELLIELFKYLITNSYNSKLERVLRHSIYLLLSLNDFNFYNLRNLLLNLEYRQELLSKAKKIIPINVTEFFLNDFNELKTKYYNETISPIIAFLDEIELLPVFNNNLSLPNIINIINNNFLTLFSLEHFNLGDKITKTISGLIIQQIFMLAESGKIKQHLILIIDEVSIIENPILSKILSGSRKYNLSLFLAGQYLNQISTFLKDSIFANVINYYIFRISKNDSEILINNFDFNIPVNNTKEQKIKLLTALNNRECLVRISKTDKLLPVFKGYTEDFFNIEERTLKNE